MKYEELININSDNPSPSLLEQFIGECNGNINFFRKLYKETRDRTNLGMITKHVKWKKIAQQKIAQQKVEKGT